MKRLLLSCLGVLFALITQAQVFFTQGFNSTLAASGWTNTNLTAPWGNGAFFGLNNQWQVSDAESGMLPNTCGAAGAGNPSLYMGAVGLGALGAAYLSNARTNRRIASPNISTVGKTNITLSFNFIGNGGNTSDKAYFQYSIDGGATWITPTATFTTSNPALPVGTTLNLLRSQICGSGQGRWTNVTWTLPATAENITNLRLAFVWQNQNPPIGGTATDPALAVDDVTLSTPIILPITLNAFKGKELTSTSNLLEWTTSSEINNDFFTIERSSDAINFEPIATIKGAGNSNTIQHYNYVDATLNIEHQTLNTFYYRLKQTDFDGQFEYFDVIAITRKANTILNVFYFEKQLHIQTNDLEEKAMIKIMDITGRIVYKKEAVNNSSINLSFLTNGVYIYQISYKNKIFSNKFITEQ